MAIVPDRLHTGTGDLGGIFPTAGGLFSGTPGIRQTGWQPRQVYGRGIGGHPFYNLAAWHQSRAYRLGRFHQGGAGQGFGGDGPPMQGGQPPRLGGYPAPMPPRPVFPGPQPIGPEPIEQQPIYYNPLGANHPAVIAARLGLYG